MAVTAPENVRDLALGVGAGGLSVLLGLVLAAVATLDRVDVLDHPAVVGVLIVSTLAFTVAGLYEIVDRGVTERGVTDLSIGAAVVLALLAPYGERSRAFVVVGAVALLGAGVYNVVHAVRPFPGSDDTATDVDREGAG